MPTCARNGNSHEPSAVFRPRVFGPRSGRAARSHKAGASAPPAAAHPVPRPSAAQGYRRSSSSMARRHCRRRAFDGVTHVVSRHRRRRKAIRCCAQHAADFAARAGQFNWVAYLSTTGVYGDHGGGCGHRGHAAHAQHRARPQAAVGGRRNGSTLWRAHGLAVHIFRLAGIYGPGRNQLLSLLDGTAKRIIKPGQVFSRIHVEDIATVLEASIARPHPGRAYNVCDDEACPPQDVVEYGAKLLGLPVPPDTPLTKPRCRPWRAASMPIQSASRTPASSRSLASQLAYPTYREGLAALAGDLKR